jgi:hypothetical protein
MIVVVRDTWETFEKFFVLGPSFEKFSPEMS